MLGFDFSRSKTIGRRSHENEAAAGLDGHIGNHQRHPVSWPLPSGENVSRWSYNRRIEGRTCRNSRPSGLARRIAKPSPSARSSARDSAETRKALAHPSTIARYDSKKPANVDGLSAASPDLTKSRMNMRSGILALSAKARSMRAERCFMPPPCCRSAPARWRGGGCKCGMTDFRHADRLRYCLFARSCNSRQR